MITVREADKIISDHIQVLPCVSMPLDQSFGKVLREDIKADRAFPPFDRVTMDGFAISSTSWKMGNRIFALEGTQKAGEPPMTLKDRQGCVEIMTGAVLPKGCDSVIPVEQAKRDGVTVKFPDDAGPGAFMNVHRQGSDHSSGEVLLTKGLRLKAPQVAVAASTGASKVSVTRVPKVAVIGTGDELVPVDHKPLSHQIRQSNSYALLAALRGRGYEECTRLHLKDDKREMADVLSKVIEEQDIIVLSGGVSMGKFDYVPEVLKRLGVEVLFHKVKQRPGRPFWFGVAKSGKPIFALPGNPVSTQVGMVRYVLPYIGKAEGEKQIGEQTAVLEEDIEVDTAFTCFYPVKVEHYFDGRILARAVKPKNSGDFVSLARSDGFVELPAETYQFSKGTTALFYRW